MGMREVVDDNGRAWAVYAIVPGSYDDLELLEMMSEAIRAPDRDEWGRKR